MNDTVKCIQFPSNNVIETCTPKVVQSSTLFGQLTLHKHLTPLSKNVLTNILSVDKMFLRGIYIFVHITTDQSVCRWASLHAHGRRQTSEMWSTNQPHCATRDVHHSNLQKFLLRWHFYTTQQLIKDCLKNKRHIKTPSKQTREIYLKGDGLSGDVFSFDTFWKLVFVQVADTSTRQWALLVGGGQTQGFIAVNSDIGPGPARIRAMANHLSVW